PASAVSWVETASAGAYASRVPARISALSSVLLPRCVPRNARCDKMSWQLGAWPRKSDAAEDRLDGAPLSRISRVARSADCVAVGVAALEIRRIWARRGALRERHDACDGPLGRRPTVNHPPSSSPKPTSRIARRAATL